MSDNTALGLMVAGVACLAYSWRQLIGFKNVMLYTGDRITLRLRNYFELRSFYRDKVNGVESVKDHLFVYLNDSSKRYDFTIRDLDERDVQHVVEIMKSTIRLVNS